MVFTVIKSDNCTFLFFAYVLFSSHRLCVLSSDYSAKPCLKKDHRIYPRSNLVFFFDIPLSSFIYITYTHICLIITYIIFYPFVFYTNIFVGMHILVGTLLFLFLLCVFVCLPSENNKEMIFINLFFVFSTDVILCMISNID